MSYVVLCEECGHDIGSHGHDGCTEHFGGGCSQTATDIARAYAARSVREAFAAEPSEAEVMAASSALKPHMSGADVAYLEHIEAAWDALRAAAKVRAEQ